MQNLKDWLSYMPAFMDLVGVVNFRIIVVEQTQNGHWNKGVLYNRGYLPTPYSPPYSLLPSLSLPHPTLSLPHPLYLYHTLSMSATSTPP